MWEITSLPGELTKMALRVEVPLDATYGVPKWILNWFQRQSLRELVEDLVAGSKRLRLPVDERVVSWARSRDEVRAVRAHARINAGHHPLQSVTAGSWLVLGSLPFAAAVATVAVSGSLWRFRSSAWSVQAAPSGLRV